MTGSKLRSRAAEFVASTGCSRLMYGPRSAARRLFLRVERGPHAPRVQVQHHQDAVGDERVGKARSWIGISEQADQQDQALSGGGEQPSPASDDKEAEAREE